MTPGLLGVKPRFAWTLAELMRTFAGRSKPLTCSCPQLTALGWSWAGSEQGAKFLCSLRGGVSPRRSGAKQSVSHHLQFIRGRGQSLLSHSKNNAWPGSLDPGEGSYLPVISNGTGTQDLQPKSIIYVSENAHMVRCRLQRKSYPFATEASPSL